jgi:hypothetical protein
MLTEKQKSQSGVGDKERGRGGGQRLEDNIQIQDIQETLQTEGGR